MDFPDISDDGHVRYRMSHKSVIASPYKKFKQEYKSCLSGSCGVDVIPQAALSLTCGYENYVPAGLASSCPSSEARSHLSVS
jgi:hypothetical protein